MCLHLVWTRKEEGSNTDEEGSQERKREEKEEVERIESRRTCSRFVAQYWGYEVAKYESKQA